MAAFNIYQPDFGEAPIARKGFIWALVASILIHVVLFGFFRATKLEHFSTATERLVPRAFTSLGRVEVDEKLLQDEPEKQEAQQKNTPEVPNVPIPDDTPSTENTPADIVYKPTAPELVKPIVNDKPKVSDTTMQTLARMQQSKDIDNDLKSVSDQLFKDKTRTSSNSLLKFSDSTKSGVTGGRNKGSGEADIPGTKSLDEALAGTGGGLHTGDKIGIKGGALFEYDKADLRPDAIEDLKKLALIVKRYPGAIFTVEGYADSLGDWNYNMDLSARRARAVQAWLLVNLGVNPFKIEAKGYGSSNFIVTPSGRVDDEEKQRQEKNRRVEISIKFPR
jgi:outer membrane protein OmpA-like peptidoglycan-associated protein